MIVPLTLLDFLRRAEEVHPDRVGFVDEPEAPVGPLEGLSFARIAAMARGQALAWERLGLDFGERVAIVSPNAARMLVSLFGTSAYGRILVPINYRLNASEVRYIVEHSGARVLLVDPALDDAYRDVTCERRIVLGPDTDEALFGADGVPTPWVADENATATINYTSGTTARPKGVQLTHRNLWINAAMMGLHLGVSDRDVYLHTLPMFHCNGWGMPYVCAAMGVKQVVLRKVDGAEILRRVDAHGVTLLCGSPTVVNIVLAAAKDWEGEIPGRGRVRIVVAGAPPPTETIRRVEAELGWEFIQIYGLTETAPLLTVNRARAEWDDLSAEARATKLGRAGVPTLGVEVKASDEGEILARGNVVLEGYWAQPEASAAALDGGWFHTGDGGAIDDEGYVTISDRKKDVIISGGENVSSIEVEDVLFSHHAVAEVAVIGVPDDKWGETVKALVVLEDGTEGVDERALIEHCRERMAHYKCPTSVELRESLPRTATGKLQKFKLRAPYWAGRDRQVS